MSVSPGAIQKREVWASPNLCQRHGLPCGRRKPVLAWPHHDLYEDAKRSRNVQPGVVQDRPDHTTGCRVKLDASSNGRSQTPVAVVCAVLRSMRAHSCGVLAHARCFGFQHAHRSYESDPVTGHDYSSSSGGLEKNRDLARVAIRSYQVPIEPRRPGPRPTVPPCAWVGRSACRGQITPIFLLRFIGKTDQGLARAQLNARQNVPAQPRPALRLDRGLDSIPAFGRPRHDTAPACAAAHG